MATRFRTDDDRVDLPSGIGPWLLLRGLMRSLGSLEGRSVVLCRRQGWLIFILGCTLKHFEVILLHRELGLSENISVCSFLLALGIPRLIIQSYLRRLLLLSGPLARDFVLNLTIIRDRFGGPRSWLFSRFVPIKPTIPHHLYLFPLLIKSLLLLSFVVHFLKEVNLIFNQLLLCHVVLEIIDLLFEYLVKGLIFYLWFFLNSF